MKKLLSLALLPALTFSLSGCGVGTSTWNGSGEMLSLVLLSYNDGDFALPGDPCESEYGEYEEAGMPVTLRDSSGSVVSLSQTEGGVLAEGYEATVENPNYKAKDLCIFKFTFDDVESDDKFYSVEVDSHGAVNVSREALETGAFRLTIDEEGALLVVPNN